MSELATEVIMTLRNRTNKYGFLAISSLFLNLSCFAQTGKDTLSVREETLDEVIVTGYVNKPKEMNILLSISDYALRRSQVFALLCIRDRIAWNRCRNMKMLWSDV